MQGGNYDKTYYLEPGDGGAKAYALLRRAMEVTGRIAIARVVIRTKESLAAIRVFGAGVLALETMHFPDEVRSPAGLTGILEPELRHQELEMAISLVSSLSGDFLPEKFENEYRRSLLELLQAKAAGEEVVRVDEQPARGRVADLMEALRASIRLAEEARGTMAPEPATVPGAPAPTRVPVQPEPVPVPGIPGRAATAAPEIPSSPAAPGPV